MKLVPDAPWIRNSDYGNYSYEDDGYFIIAGENDVVEEEDEVNDYV